MNKLGHILLCIVSVLGLILLTCFSIGFFGLLGTVLTKFIITYPGSLGLLGSVVGFILALLAWDYIIEELKKL